MKLNTLLQLTLLLSRTQCGVLAVLISTCAMSAAQACEHMIVLSSWQSCAVGKLSTNGGDPDWAAVPAWHCLRRHTAVLLKWT